MEIETYTAPQSAPDSINDDEGIEASTQAVLGDTFITQKLAQGGSSKYDAVLVACFSVHNLVGELAKAADLAVTGIFEASILTALSLLPASGLGKWGIVTTGQFWEKHLSDGVSEFLGQSNTTTSSSISASNSSSKFAGVFSTGLTAGDFHTVSPQDVEAKLKHSTRRLFASGEVRCVVMGCGGMAGLEDIIRSVAVEVYGEDKAQAVYIVDGVQAGILQLQQTVLSRRTFGSRT